MSFLRNLLSTVLGIFISIVLLIFIIIGIIGIASQEKPLQVSNNTILKIEIKNNLIDRIASNKWDFLKEKECSDGLDQITYALEKAKVDDKIQAIYLEIGELKSGIANIQALRRSILDFKTTGKKVLVHTQGTSQLGYYLASSADSIFMEPVAHIEWKGIGAQLMYFKDLLDKVGVQAEPIRVGKFKSAIEPFILNEMSSENEFQVKELISGIWEQIVSDVARERKSSIEALNFIANEKGFLLPEEALKSNFIDAIIYKDEMFAKFQNEKAKFLDYKTYAKQDAINDKNSKIAVLYANGTINEGYSDMEISGERYVQILEEVLNDDSYKALVVRINSPGGSAKASENIWRQLELINKKIPVIISLGDVAASGGYYIAAAGDKIFTERGTVTGSIGVFGLMFNAEELSKKFGVHVQRVKTNDLSDFPSFDRSLSEKEKNRLTTAVEKIYEIFVDRVSQGRQMTPSEVNEIAGGRVWTGTDAIKIGLADTLGGLSDAIAYATQITGLPQNRTLALPKQLSPIEAFAEELNKDQQISLPEPFKAYNYWLNSSNLIPQLSKPQARLPFLLELQ